MEESEIEYIKNNIENMKFYKGNDNSEIVFIKKKIYGTEKQLSKMLKKGLKKAYRKNRLIKLK